MDSPFLFGRSHVSHSYWFPLLLMHGWWMSMLLRVLLSVWEGWNELFMTLMDLIWFLGVEFKHISMCYSIKVLKAQSLLRKVFRFTFMDDPSCLYARGWIICFENGENFKLWDGWLVRDQLCYWWYTYLKAWTYYYLLLIMLILLTIGSLLWMF